MSAANTFLAGANMLGYLVAALLFLRARRRTGDPLFFAFAAAFFVLGVDQIATLLTGPDSDRLATVFMPRLIVFSLLIVAIVAKNLRGRAR